MSRVLCRAGGSEVAIVWCLPLSFSLLGAVIPKAAGPIGPPCQVGAVPGKAAQMRWHGWASKVRCQHKQKGTGLWQHWSQLPFHKHLSVYTCVPSSMTSFARAGPGGLVLWETLALAG